MEIALIVCASWILAVCFHEFGHALVAYLGGDKSVKDKGYLTFNIFKYTDPGMTLFFPVLILVLGGIALPGAAVYIDHSRLRSRLWESAVSAAGPLFTALGAIILAVPFLLNWDVEALPKQAWLALAFAIQLQMYALILNSLPIPSFDGYGFIEPWLPQQIRERLSVFTPYGIWIVFLVIWTVPAANEALWAVTNALTSLLKVPPQLAAYGYLAFKQNAGWLVIALIGILLLMRKKDKPQHRSEVEAYKDAQRLLSENKPIEAINALDEALTKNQDFPEAWHLRGICFALMNRNDEALSNFAQALMINPRYADCWYNKACCHALQGQNEQALRDLRQAILLDPLSITAHAKQDVGFRGLWQDPRFLQLVNASLR